MAKIIINESEFELNIRKSISGPDALDVSRLYQESGFFTYDPGLMSTAPCSSSITFIDGEEGVLRYRGYNAVDLAQKYDFLTIAYLLLNGELPLPKEYKKFTQEIASHSKPKISKIIQSFPRESTPMAILVSSFSALAAIYNDPKNYPIIAIAQVPVIIATIYRHISNLQPIDTDNSLGYVENFLRMMFDDDKHKQGLLVESFSTIFTLHADHEQNASTATVRLAASAGANPFACLAAGSTTLSGPAHGGANEAVITMLHEIEEVKNVANFIERVKKKELRLMGFGHRVYKSYDPRANVLREVCHKVLAECNSKSNEMLEIALKLEEIALSDDYFLERKLYPNVDFYSGIIFQSIGIPAHMFTTLFALARTAGWVAQLSEFANDKEQKICRPRQVYIGEKSRVLR